MTTDSQLAELNVALEKILKTWPNARAMRSWFQSNIEDLPMTPEEFIKIARLVLSVTKRELHAREQQRS